MLRVNSNICKRHKSQNDCRYELEIELGEIVVIKQPSLYQDESDLHTGHVVGITQAQYRIFIFGGTVIQQKKTVCSNQIRGHGRSLSNDEFQKAHPAPERVKFHQEHMRTVSAISMVRNITSIQIPLFPTCI